MPSPYYLKFWGGVQNDNWIERDLGVAGTDFWFDTPEERAAFRQKLQQCADAHKCVIAFDQKEGSECRLRTIASMTMDLPDGRPFPYRYDFGFGYDPASAEFMFFDGNYSCDCNKSRFLARAGYQVEEMPCGDTIQLRDFTVTQEP